MGDLHEYLVFFTRHVYQPVNNSILHIDPDLHWHGQIFVMKLGKRDSSRLVNFRTEDVTFAKIVVMRYILACSSDYAY
jgi:hypothetical protein